MTVQGEVRHPARLGLAYVGDGRNNVANSLLIGCAMFGMDVRIVSPESLFPETWLVETARAMAAKTGGKVTITADVAAGVAGSHAIYTDVWASMGEEDKIAERIALLKPYQVTVEMIEATGRQDAIFLHCLPASTTSTPRCRARTRTSARSEDEVFEGPWSRVFDEAENRMHTIKAVMVATLGR